MGFKFRDEVIEDHPDREPQEGGPLEDVVVSGNSIADEVHLKQGDQHIVITTWMAKQLQEKMERI